VNDATANEQSGTTNGSGGSGGFAVGPRNSADGGGVALNDGNTNDMSGGIALNGGQDHPGCNIAIGTKCFNLPGRSHQ
jgi:hypothetical protein